MRTISSLCRLVIAAAFAVVLLVFLVNARFWAGSSSPTVCAPSSRARCPCAAFRIASCRARTACLCRSRALL